MREGEEERERERERERDAHQCLFPSSCTHMLSPLVFVPFHLVFPQTWFRSGRHDNRHGKQLYQLREDKKEIGRDRERKGKREKKKQRERERESGRGRDRKTKEGQE